MKRQIEKYQKIIQQSFKASLHLKYLCIFLLLFGTISCDKKDVTDEEEFIDDEIFVPFGEKTFQIGKYQTIPIKIETAKDSGFVVIGYASDMEREEYPFLMLLNDSLKQRKVLFPAFNEIQTRAMGLAKLTDGYVILSTTSESPTETNDGVRLTKVSFDGEIIWEKKYFSGVISVGPNIAVDKDNSVIVACQQALTPDYRFYSRIAKFDSNGNLLWDYDMYPGILNQPGTIVTNKQNDFIAIIDSITDCHTCEQDRVSVPIVHKMDKDGKILWKSRLDSDNGRGWSSIIAIDNNNDIIIAYEPGNQKNSFYYNKKVIIKMDNFGNIIWQTTLDQDMFEGRTDNAGGFEEMREIAIDEKNNIYVIGNINEDIFWGPRRAAIAKLNRNGEVIKTKIYKEDSQYQGLSIESLSNDRLIVLANKYFPYEIAVFYINGELEIQ